MDDRGRIVLPASVRKALEVRSGDRLILTVEPEGDVRLVSMRKQVERCEGLFATLARPGRLASEELVAERRREAAGE